MKYETYRRIRVSSPFVFLLYWNMIGAIILIVIPYLLATGREHLDLDPPHAVRFISSVPPPASSETDELRHSRLRQCRSLLASNGSEACEFRDFMEIIESDSESAFITTAVSERLESRTVSFSNGGESGDKDDDAVLIPSAWKPVEESSSSTAEKHQQKVSKKKTTMLTVAPELTTLRIEHRLKNAGIAMDQMHGFLLSLSECLQLEDGEGDIMAVVDKLRFTVGPDSAANKRPLDNPGRKTFFGGRDEVTVEQLLTAANVTMDEVRRSGAHLDVSYFFTNTHGRVVAGVERSFIQSSLIDLLGMPGDSLYLVCVEAVQPHDARFFYSNRLESSSSTAQPEQQPKIGSPTTSATRDGRSDLAAGGGGAASSSTSRKQKIAETQYRVIRTHRGIRASFRATGAFGTFYWSKFVRFLGSAAGFFSIAGLISEFVLSYVPLIDGMTPIWWRDFYLD